jgi:hypothetical protein
MMKYLNVFWLHLLLVMTKGGGGARFSKKCGKQVI